MKSIYALGVVFIAVFTALLPPVSIIKIEYFIHLILFAEAAAFAVAFVYDNIYQE